MMGVEDALAYIDLVKVTYQNRPEVYDQFLNIMNDFKAQGYVLGGLNM